MLRRLNFQVHDSDKAAHQLMGPGGRAIDDIISLFGSEVVNMASGVNRIRLGNIVFADPAKRVLLEQILHPLIVSKNRDLFSITDFSAEKRCFWMCPCYLRQVVTVIVIV